MSGILGFEDIDRSKIDFWDTEWKKLSEEQKNIYCKMIGLKSREWEGEFLALMTYQSHRKEMGIIQNIL
jgi:hypothetical protein